MSDIDFIRDCFVAAVLTQLGFWQDDSQVCVESVTKTYQDVPGADIKIEPLADATGVSGR